MSKLVFTPDGLFEFEMSNRGQQVISPVVPRELPLDSFAKIVEDVCYLAIAEAEGTEYEEKIDDRCQAVAEALYAQYCGNETPVEEPQALRAQETTS